MNVVACKWIVHFKPRGKGLINADKICKSFIGYMEADSLEASADVVRETPSFLEIIFTVRNTTALHDCIQKLGKDIYFNSTGLNYTSNVIKKYPVFEEDSSSDSGSDSDSDIIVVEDDDCNPTQKYNVAPSYADVNLSPFSPVKRDLVPRCAKAAGISIGVETQLGRGIQGRAYSIVNDATRVLKISTLLDKKTTAEWVKEAEIACALGQEGIGPQVYTSFQCNSSGFILMDKLTVASDRYPVGGNGAYTHGDYDDITAIPRDIQQGFIDVLLQSIRFGYLHLDNHWDNVGFVKTRPILFDFGFAQPRSFKRDSLDEKMALAFSIGILLQNAEYTTQFGTLLYETFASLVGIASSSKDALEAAFPLGDNSIDTKKSIVKDFFAKAYSLATSPANVDVFVGSYCYACLFQFTSQKRSNNYYRNVVYKIRQNNAPNIQGYRVMSP